MEKGRPEPHDKKKPKLNTTRKGKTKKCGGGSVSRSNHLLVLVWLQRKSRKMRETGREEKELNLSRDFLSLVSLRKLSW